MHLVELCEVCVDSQNLLIALSLTLNETLFQVTKMPLSSYASSIKFLACTRWGVYEVLCHVCCAGDCVCPGDGHSHAGRACLWDKLQHLVPSCGRGLLYTTVRCLFLPCMQLHSLPHQK